MAKFNNFWRVTLVICLVACLSLTLVACGGSSGGGGEGGTNGGDTSTQGTTAGTYTYSLQVSTVSGMKLNNLSVYVYTDSTMEELETVKQLDENGSASFTAVEADYVAVLMGVPAGYDVEAYYTFDERHQANILLTSSVITDVEKPADKVYQLGDVMYDFTITASDGTEYTLSELLKEKDAVVLNFWYLNCNPCKLEFPYLEMSYGYYSDRIELLAINCEDGNDAELNAFRQENELTFPMAIGDKDYWYPAAYSACPTTIVVDRYGMIVYMHAGYFDEMAPFNALFRMVTGEDYTQTLITDLESLITEDDYRPDGTEERPFELGGATEFDVKVPANGEVYYNLYRYMDVTMRIENPNAYVIIDGETHYPVDGVIEIPVSCEDTFKPLRVAFGNSSGSKNTIHVEFIFEPGNINNPFELGLGDNEVIVEDVNGLGVYYTYTASTTGTLQIAVLDCTDLATAEIHLYNNNTLESVYLSSDGVIDEENGYLTVSISVNAGDVIQIIFSASTAEGVVLPSATIHALASILESGGNGVIDDGKTGYSISVVDQDGNPLPDVRFHLSSNGQSKLLTTDETGLINIRLVESAYFLELVVPNGYMADTTSYLWSPAKRDLTIQLSSTMEYCVQVQTSAGVPLSGVLVQIYADETMERLLYAVTTDEAGVVHFVGKQNQVHYLVLSAVSEDWTVDAFYVMEGQELVIGLRSAAAGESYQVGDMVADFTVTDVEQHEYTLSQLLEQKQAVILVFWRNNDLSSTYNLMNLQQIYQQYSDQVAVLAMHPANAADAELRLFQSRYGLTFPLINCDGAWIDTMCITDYPTTVMIDREGKISLIHSGVISEENYEMIFGFYAAEDYVHVTFDSLMDLLEHIKLPDTPVIPDVPENPEDPENPDVPENPEDPENPEVPEGPENPEDIDAPNEETP